MSEGEDAFLFVFIEAKQSQAKSTWTKTNDDLFFFYVSSRNFLSLKGIWILFCNAQRKSNLIDMHIIIYYSICIHHVMWVCFDE